MMSELRSLCLINNDPNDAAYRSISLHTFRCKDDEEERSNTSTPVCMFYSIDENLLEDGQQGLFSESANTPVNELSDTEPSTNGSPCATQSKRGVGSPPNISCEVELVPPIEPQPETECSIVKESQIPSSSHESLSSSTSQPKSEEAPPIFEDSLNPTKILEMLQNHPIETNPSPTISHIWSKLADTYRTDSASGSCSSNTRSLVTDGPPCPSPPLSGRPPPFQCRDFWPLARTRHLYACDTHCVSFDILVNQANVWLKENPCCQLATCETISKKVLLTRDITSTVTSYSDPHGPTPAATIMGLRLWYREVETDSECGAKAFDSQSQCGAKHCTHEELRYFDILPVCTFPSRKQPKFEGCAQTVRRINQRLLEEPLSGPILSIETLQLRFPQEDWRAHLTPDPAVTLWYNEYNVHMYAFIRIFYRHSKHVIQQIGFQDFAPELLDQGSLFHPAKYSSFSSLLKHTTAWINRTSDKTVLSIKTLNAKHRRKIDNKTSRFRTDAMFERKIERRFRAYFLRVAYLLTLSRDQLHPINLQVALRSPRLACRTFLPDKMTDGSYESMESLMGRICTHITDINGAVYCVETVAIPEWMVAERSKVLGQQADGVVYCVETVAIPEWMAESALSESGEHTFFDGEWFFIPDADGNDKGPYRYPVLYGVRVYFDCPPLYTELQRRISSYTLRRGCCVIQ